MASGCDQHLNPLPWLLVGIAMFIGGIVAHARRGWPACQRPWPA
jgi:hypothetical protein